jgi:lysyl-tRNA synthetase class 2
MEKIMNQYQYRVENRIADLYVYRQNRVVPEHTHAVTAGRILSLRAYRSIIFFDLHEDGQFIQCAIRANENPEPFAYFRENISRGNLAWVDGHFGTTQTGEVTLFVESIQLINRNAELINDLHDGLNQSVGRQMRELDLMLNPSSMQRFRQRSQIIWSMREYFNRRDFIEVETPILQSVASGAQATPFVTRFNANNRDAYLRIAPETYLVRLLVGGMSRIFEIGHNFRNEGLSPRHNPEFSMLEFYETYRNMEDTIAMTEDIIVNAVETIGLNPSEVVYGEYVLNFRNFGRFTVAQSLQHFLSYSEENVNNREFLLDVIRESNITNTMPSENIEWLQYLIFEELVEPLLIQPTFITDLPVEASPLAYSENNRTTVRFEMFCAGREIANGFQQVLSYEEQVERFNFQAQINGRDSAMEADMDYMNSIRYGIPTVTGCGIGIDRFIMLLTNTENIRDIILYPIVNA